MISRRDFFKAMAAVGAVASLPKTLGSVHSMAIGGFVTPTPYLVGEIGPELVLPREYAMRICRWEYHEVSARSGSLLVRLIAMATPKMTVMANAEIKKPKDDFIRYVVDKMRTNENLTLRWPDETPNIVPAPTLDGQDIDDLQLEHDYGKIFLDTDFSRFGRRVR